MRCCEECGVELPEGSPYNRKRCARLECARSANSKSKAKSIARTHGVAIGDCIRCREPVESEAVAASVCSSCSMQMASLRRGSMRYAEALSPETEALIEEIRANTRRVQRMTEEIRRTRLGIPAPPRVEPERVDPWAGYVSPGWWP